MSGFAYRLALSRNVTDPRFVYALHEIGEETRHSRLCVRIVEQLKPKARNPFESWLAVRVRSRLLPLLLRRPATLDAFVLPCQPGVACDRRGRPPRSADTEARELTTSARMQNAVMRPFKFLAHPEGVYSGKDLAEVARRAEGLGYTALVFPDHLGMSMSPVPAMATVLAATERLRAAPFVLNVDLHQPAVLAQDLASLDVFSEGRVDVAIGAGWNKPEYDSTGLSFDPVGTRVARLTEAVAILKGCFGDGPFSLAGNHYTVTDFDSQPKPVQKPHPPFFIGGGGRRTLELAAREANVVGLAPRLLNGRGDPRSMTIEATAEKIEWVKTAAGDRFAELELNAYPSGAPVVVTDDLKGEAGRISQRLREITGVELTEQEVIDSPHIFVGSVDRLTEKFTELRERLGITSFMVGGVDELAPVVERLAGS